MSVSFSALLAALFGYFAGAFPTAYVIGKLFSHTDIRKLGSGNVGATNALRVLGLLPGLITLIIDMAKGFLAVLLVAWLSKYRFQTWGIGYLPKLETLSLLTGLAAVTGHDWPIFLKFKGGKGVATTLGVLLALFPQVALSVMLVWFLVLVLSRYVSLASVVSAIALPFFIWLYFSWLDGKHLIGYGLILGIFILWRHQENIKRLFRHQERKLTFSKSG